MGSRGQARIDIHKKTISTMFLDIGFRYVFALQITSPMNLFTSQLNICVVLQQTTATSMSGNVHNGKQDTRALSRPEELESIDEKAV